MLALALLTAGLLSKSVMVTLPVALLIVHWRQRGQVTRNDLLRLAPFFLVAAAIVLADLSFYRSRESLELGYTLAERVLIAARALWFYLGKLLWPTELAVIYPLWEINAADPSAWAYPVASAALAAVLWWGRQRMGRELLAGALFFAVTLGPTLGFVDYGYMQFSFVADRFQYLAGIDALAVLTGVAVQGAERLPRSFRLTARGLAAVVVAFLGVLTWRQASIYQDEITFFSHIVALNPTARNAHLNLSSALTKAGRNEEGLAVGHIALERRPDFADAHSNLALAQMNLERFEAAGESLRSALELDPRHRNSLQNAAELYRKQGRHQEAVEAYGAVLARDQRYAPAYAGMGDALFQIGRYDQAVAALQRSLSLQPDAEMAGGLHHLLGRTFQKLGRLEAAAQQFDRALTILPQNAQILIQLANLSVMQGRTGEADDYLRRARALRPHDVATLQNVAESFRKLARYEESLAAYRAVLELDAEYALAHAGIGDALFRLHRYEEALASMSKAAALRPDLMTAGTLPRIMGVAAQELGRPEAADHFERALEIDPRDAEALNRLAMLRFGEQHYEAASGLYRKLAEINPDSAHAHSNLGATLYHLGRFDEALRHTERALVLDPDLKNARIGLDLVRRALQQPDR